MKPTSIKTPIEISSERKAKRFYIGLVLLLFAIQCTILTTAITLAIGDPALAVVPDYHQAALAWDESRAATRSAGEMGWDLDVNVSDVADGKGMRVMQFHALDQDHQPLSELNVRAKIYRHARADEVERFELDSIGDGTYQSMPRMPDPGLWQIELDVRNAGRPMTLSKTVELQ